MNRLITAKRDTLDYSLQLKRIDILGESKLELILYINSGNEAHHLVSVWTDVDAQKIGFKTKVISCEFKPINE